MKKFCLLRFRTSKNKRTTSAHFWANSDSAPRSEAVGTPLGGRGYVASHFAHLWATSDFAPRYEAVGTP